jgi:type I restriction enzyme, S subunit
MRPYVRAANVGWSGWRLEDVKTMNFTDQEMDTYRLQPGDLLLGEASGSASEVGKPALWEGQIDDCAFQNTLIRVRPTDASDSRYLLHFFRYCASTGQFARSSRGVGIFHLGSKALADWKVPLPPIEEQRRIAAVLDAADELRAKRRNALAKLGTLTRAIFIDMFGPTGLAGELIALGDVLANAEVFTDGDWVESKDQDPTGEVRLTQLADIGVGTWLDRSERYMNRATAERLKCTFLERGDVLVARMPDPIGRACIFPGDRRPSVTAVDVCIIRPGPESVDARWLVEALNLPRTQSEIQRRATGSTRSRISRRNMAKVEVAVPPLEAQREFAARAAEVERARTAQLGSGERLNDLFSSLQQRVFRGEL